MGKKVFLRYGGKQEFTSKGVTYSENIYDRSIIYDLGKEEDVRKLQAGTIRLLIEGYSCRIYDIE